MPDSLATVVHAPEMTVPQHLPQPKVQPQTEPTATSIHQSVAAGAGPTVRLTCAQAVIEFFQNQLVEQLDGSFQPMVYGYWGIFGHGNVCGIGQALEERERTGKLR
jgi:hypothetical protein